jgi:hypothetical protein
MPVGPVETEAAEEGAPETDETLVVEEPIAEAVLDDADESTESEGAEGTGATLKDALMRTAAQMESEGIVAPESVGPAEELPTGEQIAVEADAAAEESAITEQPAAPGEASWPWDVAQENDAAGASGFSMSALEEPAVDVEGGLLRTSVDDETFAAARPVILGAYGGEGISSVDVEPVAEVAPAVEAEFAAEVAPAAETVPTVELENEADEISDFIFDLEASIAESAPSEEGVAQAPEAVAEVVAGMSCEDCVYVATCPNKDQRDPATCGSFQWK